MVARCSRGLLVHCCFLYSLGSQLSQSLAVFLLRVPIASLARAPPQRWRVAPLSRGGRYRVVARRLRMGPRRGRGSQPNSGSAVSSAASTASYTAQPKTLADISFSTDPSMRVPWLDSIEGLLFAENPNIESLFVDGHTLQRGQLMVDSEEHAAFRSQQCQPAACFPGPIHRTCTPRR